MVAGSRALRDSMTTPSDQQRHQLEEAVSKMVFQRLDPVLRMLCEAVKEYHRRRSGQQNRISLLRTMADMLERLQSQLEALGRTTTGAANDQAIVSSSLCIMMQFITLPLLAILRTCSGEGACWNDWNEGNSDDTVAIVERSAVWKCLEGSCRVLRIALQAIRIDDQERLQGMLSTFDIVTALAEQES